MSLHVEHHGNAGHERLVLLHGFTQTGCSWRAIAEQLSQRYEVLLVDAPGHGASSAVTTNLWDTADLVTGAAGAATYVGYSMGGRIALHAALRRPDIVRRLVLLGATPGIEDPDEQRRRRDDDERLATQLEHDGVERFVDTWLTNPLFAGLSPEQAQRDDRLRNTAAGLAASLRLCGTGQQANLWPRLGEVTMPTLVMAGALDTKFAALAGRIAAGIGQGATTALVAGAGHAAHLEQPEEFLQLLDRWLSAVPDPR